MLEKTGVLPTIPEYYRSMIDPKVDLNRNPKQCCPFHHETAPSFSYSVEREVWSCFGGCHCRGADVIEMHRRNYGLRTREDAERSLNALCGIVVQVKLSMENSLLRVDNSKVESNQVYLRALQLANNPDRWLELDYFMSQTPVDLITLGNLVDKWTNAHVVEDGVLSNAESD